MGTNKAGAHTQGEWKTYERRRNISNSIDIAILDENLFVARCPFNDERKKETAKANAEMICKAVNNYKSLVKFLDEYISTMESEYPVYRQPENYPAYFEALKLKSSLEDK